MKLLHFLVPIVASIIGTFFLLYLFKHKTHYQNEEDNRKNSDALF